MSNSPALAIAARSPVCHDHQRGCTRASGLAIAFGALLASWGCSSGSLTRELLDQQNDFAREDCNCNFAEEGYDSAGECREESTFPIPAAATSCGDRALRADGTGEMVAATRCLVDHGAVRLECVRAASCEEAALAECDQAYIVAVASCPQPSAEAQAAFNAALQTCIRGGGGGGPQIDGCPEDDLASDVGAAVATGSTRSGDNDLGGTCGGDRSNDATFSWTAPESGTVTIDTFGSEYDTVLYVLEGTCGSDVELACNDDAGIGFQSQVSIPVTAGETFIIVIDGFGSDEGDYVLNINY